MQFADTTIAPPPPPPAPAPTGPAMPWTVRECPAIGGVMRRHKHYPATNITSVMLSTEDEQILAYVAHLEQENTRLKRIIDSNEELRVLLDAGPPAGLPVPSASADIATNTASPTEPTPAAGEATAANKRQRAEEELLKAPGDSNGVIAERAGVSDEYVRRIRKELEAAGRLEPVR